MKRLILFLLLIPFASKAQYNDGKFIATHDTLEVLNYLNGTWKLKIKSKVHFLTFNFSEDELVCIDSDHPNWYDGTDTKYELTWSSNGQIYLNCYTRNSKTRAFESRPYSHQILPVTQKRMMMDINGDFGVFELKKHKGN